MGILAWVMIVATGVVPTLGRSKGALCIFAALAAIIPLGWLVAALVAVDGVSAWIALSMSVYTGVIWAIGLLVANWQRTESDRGNKWAAFPFPTLATLLGIGGLNLLFIWA